MKWIDIPPVWLLGAAVLVWFSRHLLSLPLPGLPGTLLVGVGLAVMAVAIAGMIGRRTTPLPHMAPAALVTGGVFGLTRNPIYLGDALVLAGLALRWDAPLGLLLVPVFMAVIQRRFILAEESRLAAAFPADFAAYCRKTRRWI